MKNERDLIEAKEMKRKNHLYNLICSVDNLKAADAEAQKRKARQPEVISHRQSSEKNIQALHELLTAGGYKTSPYKTFKIYEPKERDVFCLPYYPDRIVHHAIIRVLEPILVSVYTADSYSCIKSRGIHAAAKKVRRALKDVAGTQYCLKMDISKFYANVDHEILKSLLRRKFKDATLLNLLFEIIDSAEGLPIGNYTSQYFANFFLSYFDHWLKEDKGVTYYFRYCDDLVFFSDNKPYLHQLLADIRAYLGGNLKLAVKGNYQVFPVAVRGVDFVGYRFFHTHTLLRKGIKKNLARAVALRKPPQTIASLMGWAKHCNSRNLIKTIHKQAA